MHAVEVSLGHSSSTVATVPQYAIVGRAALSHPLRSHCNFDRVVAFGQIVIACGLHNRRGKSGRWMQFENTHRNEIEFTGLLNKTTEDTHTGRCTSLGSKILENNARCRQHLVAHRLTLLEK